MAHSGKAETFRHRTGQITGYTCYGNPSGPTVFYFHGVPSSRLEAAAFDEAAQKQGVRIVAVDRPGIGLSSVQNGRGLLDWPPLISELAERLEASNFYILGVSAGGAYALACAKMLPADKLKGVGIVAGMSPTALGLDGLSFGSKMTIYATRLMPGVGRKLYDWFVIPASQNPNPQVFERMVVEGAASMGKKDKELMENPRMRTIIVNAAREHYLQGNAALADEWRIFVTDWGFDLKDIDAENIKLWCGTEDNVCPVALSRKMASVLSGAELYEIEGETHYTILANRTEEILRGLVPDKKNLG